MHTRTRLILLLLATAGTLATLAAPSVAMERGPAPWRNPDLTPEESRLLFMEHTTRLDLDAARFQTLEVPPGFMVVGDVVDGEFRFGVAEKPDLNPALPPANAVLPLWNGAVDCENDDVPQDVWEWYTVYPAHYNLWWPLERNAATAGDCIGTDPFEGPITHFEFSWAGDVFWWDYGAVDVYDYATGSGFYIECSPSGAWGGAGVGDQWTYTFQGSNTLCTIVTVGYQPSQCSSWDALVFNSALATTDATAYAAFQ